MMAYPEYKATGLHWLPQIPKHWDWLFLSQISEEQKIKNIAAKEKNVLSLSYGNIIRKKNLNGGLTPQDWATYQIVFPGNIILRLTDLQNDHTSLRTGLVKEQGIITSAYTCVKTSHNSAFLHYLLHAYDIQKVFYGFGGGVRQSIGYKALRNLCFPIPAPDEQAQIVRYLDAMTAKINKLIRAKKKQIALLQEQKQAIINQAVTKGLDPKVEMKDSGIDWLGKIPKHWKHCYVKNLGKFQAGTNLTVEDLNDSGQYPVFGGNGIRGYYDRYAFDGDYLLIGRQGALCGNVHCFKGKFWPTEHAITVAVDSHFDFMWVYYLLSTMNLNQYSQAAAQPGISVDKIRNIKTVYVEHAEQAAIVTHIQRQCSTQEKAIQILENELDALREYKNSLVSAVVTGKMDVRGLAIGDVLPEDMTINDEEAGEDVEEEMTEAEREGEVL